MRAVMYGAGNIGRGFVGALMSQAGYEVSFIDVNKNLVDLLNKEKQYTLRVIDNEGFADTSVTNVNAVYGGDEDAVVQAIANCDLMATAVGARVMPNIAPLIAKGLQRRFSMGKAPLNIIICENLMDANLLLEKLIKQDLTEKEQVAFDRLIGLVEASIGRMVPVQTEEMKQDDPLRVSVEAYGFLPVDKTAFKGQIPQMDGLVPFSPFDYYLKRKLYLHNMGHACCAYMGLYAGKTYIYEAISQEDIELITQNAMLESVGALSQQYTIPAGDLLNHANDLIFRFGNRKLMDTCQRVGNDINRKLSNTDRLIGAGLLCQQQGIAPVYIAMSAAGALHHFLEGEEMSGHEDSAENILQELSGLSSQSNLSRLILDFYPMFKKRASLAELRNFAKARKHEVTGQVI